MPGGVRAATAIGGLLLLLLLFAAGLSADDVLLNLPREFDVTARRLAWDDAPADIERPPPLVFRFRGESFRATRRWVYRPSPDNPHVYEETFEGTFRRGVLEGAHEHYIQGSLTRPLFPPPCPPLFLDPYHKQWEKGRIEGTATPDGLLSLTLHVTWHKEMVRRHERDGGPHGCHRDLGWEDTTRKSETQYAIKWTPRTETIVLRLPVGELQSTQTLSTPQPARRRAGTGSSGADASGAATGDGAAAGGRAEEAATVTGDGAPGPSGTAGASGHPGASGGEESPWSVPVTPGEAAGAGVAVALTSLLGALWMFGTSGLSPGDLLGSAPEAGAPEPPPAEAPPPREAFVESHRDGEVRPETGEVWSESVGGWVGENFHEIERRHQAEVRRAQDVSDRESRRESARIAEELRASRQREEAAARRGAEAAEDAAWLEAPTIEPYQPGWTDHMTKGLEWAEWGTDTSMSVLGSLTGPAGETGGRVYTVAKETVKGLSEGVADYVRGQGGHLAGEGSAWVIVERGTIGATKGAAKVGLDKVTGDLMNGAGEKLAGSAASEGAQALVRTVVDQLDSPAAVETCRSVSIAVGKALAGSEMVAPVNKGIKAVTGEDM